MMEALIERLLQTRWALKEIYHPHKWVGSWSPWRINRLLIRGRLPVCPEVPPMFSLYVLSVFVLPVPHGYKVHNEVYETSDDVYGDDDTVRRPLAWGPLDILVPSPLLYSWSISRYGAHNFLYSNQLISGRSTKCTEFGFRLSLLELCFKSKMEKNISLYHTLFLFFVCNGRLMGKRTVFLDPFSVFTSMLRVMLRKSA